MDPARPTAHATILVRGVSVVVHDSGEPGDTAFLLLQGIGRRPYRRLTARLAGAGRVLSIELHRCRSASRSRRRMDVEEQATIVAATLDRLDIDAVVAIGHALGSQIALELAVRRPDLVSHLVMIGPVVDPSRGSAVRHGLFLLLDGLLEPLATKTVVIADSLRSSPLRWFREFRQMRAYPTLERARGLAVPLLTVRGAQDPIARESWCGTISVAAGAGSHVTVRRMRHAVVHTAPTAVAAAIGSFASRPSSTRS